MNGVSPTGDRKCVGFVGLGAMGRPMSDHLIAAGWEVVGFDLDDTARTAHVEAGGRVVDSVGELSAQHIVLTSLPDAAALEHVLDRIGHPQRPHRILVVETSTLTVTEKETARDKSRVLGIDLVDCPVSGTSAQAEVRDLVAYVSSDEQASTDLARGVMGDVTRETYDVGVFGNGTRVKLVANTLVAVHNLAAAEALLLAERAGLDLDRTLEAVADGAGGSRMLQVRGPLMTARNYDHATARVDLFRKDIRAIRALADTVGAPMPLLAAAAIYYDAAMAQGRSHQDTASVHAVMQELVADRSTSLPEIRRSDKAAPAHGECRSSMGGRSE